MKICVIGLGYIGLPLAGLLAINDFKVIGVDINSYIVDCLNKGEVLIKEAGLERVIQAGLKSKTLKASEKPEEADVFIITVQTPLRNGKPDLSYVFSAIKSIMPFLEDGNLIIIESTCPVGTTEKIKEIIDNENIYIAYCPERVIPGNILFELQNNDRIIGGINKTSSLLAYKIYKEICINARLHITDARTAEFVKLIENSYRCTNIAFANQIAIIAEKEEVNAWEAIELANKHPRVEILNPGPGVGGHCIPIDPLFLPENVLIETSLIINDIMPEIITDRVIKEVKDITLPRVAIFGLSYKGNTEDRRNSPAYKIIEILRDNKIIINVYDPYPEINEFYYFKNKVNACSDADCIVIVADHKEFKEMNPVEISKYMRNKIVIDTRNILNKKEWQEAGFKYILLGDGRKQLIGAVN